MSTKNRIRSVTYDDPDDYYDDEEYYDDYEEGEHGYDQSHQEESQGGEAEILAWALQELQHLLIGPPRLSFPKDVLEEKLRETNYEPELTYHLLKSMKEEQSNKTAAGTPMRRNASVVDLPDDTPPPPAAAASPPAAAAGPPGLAAPTTPLAGLRLMEEEGEGCAAGPVSPPVLPREDADEGFSSPAAAPAAAAEARSEDEGEEEGDGRTKLSLVVLGHVDAGKSTLMGQVLLQLGQVEQRTVHKFKREAAEAGKASFFLAWVLDEGSEERAHGVTMDIGTKHIRTPTKDVTLLDAPGHQDFIPKMISGTSQADAAVLVVPAAPGEFEAAFVSSGQTKEHAVLARGLGVKQVLVAVNKLDAADPPWSRERFDRIQGEVAPFLAQVGFKPRQVRFVPVSGMTGENVLQVSEGCPLREWYAGPSFLEMVDGFNPPRQDRDAPLRAFVTDVIPTGGRGGVAVACRCAAGRVRAGQRVQVFPNGDVGTVRNILSNGESATRFCAGDNAEITIADVDPLRISVGHVLCKPNAPPFVGERLTAQIRTLDVLQVPIIKGTQFSIHTQSVDVPCHVVKLISILNNSGEVQTKKPRALMANTTAVVKLEAAKPLCLERYRDCRPLGQFVLRQRGVTVAAGIVTDVHHII